MKKKDNILQYAPPKFNETQRDFKNFNFVLARRGGKRHLEELDRTERISK